MQACLLTWQRLARIRTSCSIFSRLCPGRRSSTHECSLCMGTRSTNLHASCSPDALDSARTTSPYCPAPRRRRETVYRSSMAFEISHLLAASRTNHLELLKVNWPDWFLGTTALVEDKSPGGLDYHHVAITEQMNQSAPSRLTDENVVDISAVHRLHIFNIYHWRYSTLILVKSNSVNTNMLLRYTSICADIVAFTCKHFVHNME